MSIYVQPLVLDELVAMVLKSVLLASVNRQGYISMTTRLLF
jgi:hypothetical protein